MDGFRRMLWVGRQHSADHIPVSALQLVTCRWFKAERAKTKSKCHSFLVRRPTRRSRGRGVTLWPVSPSLIRPRPLALALGASKKEQERAGRQDPRRYLDVAVLEGKASVCTTWFFGLWLSFAECRFVPARRCSNPAWCKPSSPLRPARPLLEFQAGPPAFVFGSVGGRSVVPTRGPTRRSKGRGVTLWCFFP